VHHGIVASTTRFAGAVADNPGRSAMTTAPAPPRPLRIPDPTSPRFVFFALHGRVSRRTFWLFGVLALLGLGVLGHALLGIAGVSQDHADAIVNLLLVWPAIAVSAKRWQDRNRSPWWVLVALVPVVGWLWALVDNGFVRGTPGINRFGAPPEH
jgi:uncharacterized membrane protein YhaH (DUF805 family)